MTTLLKLPLVKERTGLSRSIIYKLLDEGRFPRPVKLAGRTNAWPDHEIEAWIQERIAEREAA